MGFEITKSLAGVEDLTLGMGTEEQTRLGTTYTITQINAGNIPYSTSQSMEDKLKALESGSDISLKYSWESEAAKRTANSYAVEPEDIEVKVYTSNGDGSFSVVTQTGVYSSLHYEAKAEDKLNLHNWEANASKMTAASYALEPTDVIVYTSNGDGTYTPTVQTGVSSAKTEAEEALAQRQLADADLVATNADVVLTHADVITTNGDVVLTHADVVSTNNNVTATNNDAASTAADRAAVETIYDNYDDRYLGSKASDPTLDNDGNPLLAGATYWNTSNSLLMFYNGATWESPDLSASQSASAASNSASAASTSEGNAATSETNAQLYEWVAEAWKMTAQSFAEEPEDVLVKIWSSNGDGTFTSANHTDYSATHYKNKAAASAAALDSAHLVYTNQENGSGILITNMLEVTQAQYDALTPLANTFYVIVG